MNENPAIISVQTFYESFLEYIDQNHRSDIIDLLTQMDTHKHYAININFLNLIGYSTSLANKMLSDSLQILPVCNYAITNFQKKLLSESELINKEFKPNVHTRISAVPSAKYFPTNSDIGSFIRLNGTIIRTITPKMLEYKRSFKCVKCKQIFTIEADIERDLAIIPPKKCLNSSTCSGTNFISANSNPDLSNYKDYQEVLIQEQIVNVKLGVIPRSISVILEDDLVDICKPGDDIIVCGTVLRRWKHLRELTVSDVEIVFKANHIHVSDDRRSNLYITQEIKEEFQDYWKSFADRPLEGRNHILSSFCPEVYGMYLVKLAFAVILAGGVQKIDSSGTAVRGEPHFLLVGDPGTGKSQLLRFASRLIPRSIMTCGSGTTSAGLTVSAIMAEGEWQFEAGALVLSDGGICCIDEFSLLREEDRASIHEAMEQQTISVAKAGMVCKLNTRCSVIATDNPIGDIYNSDLPLEKNIKLESPLLSRFDLTFIVLDKKIEELDRMISDVIVEATEKNSKPCSQWPIEKLRSYFAIIKNTHPEMTNESNILLSRYYQEQRQNKSRNPSRTTVRLLESLVRLAQAHAKLMFRTKVDIQDAVIAIVLIEYSMHDSGIMQLDGSLNDAFPENPITQYEAYESIIFSRLNFY